MRKLIETAGRLVANKNAPGSGVTAPYGTIDDTGRVRLSQTVIRQWISDVTPLMGSLKAPERRIQKMPAKKVSRVIDVQKNNPHTITNALQTHCNALHTTINQCANTRGVEAQVKRISFIETSFEIWLL